MKKIIKIVVILAVVFAMGKVGNSDMKDQLVDAAITQQMVNR